MLLKGVGFRKWEIETQLQRYLVVLWIILASMTDCWKMPSYFKYVRLKLY